MLRQSQQKGLRLMARTLPANAARFTGFADVYDRYRPAVPVVVADILTQLAQVNRPHLVVDLACGTGLSTRLWAGRADKVIGIEPNPDMRRQAVKTTKALKLKGITYQDGTSTHTGLPDGCADIVTCCQALHWMEPKATLAEIKRILRPGGVFAACDARLKPTMTWEAMKAFETFHKRVHRAEKKYDLLGKGWRHDTHLKRMKASGVFQFVTELAVHGVEFGNADRLVGLAKSMSLVPALLKRGLTEEQIGLAQLRETAKRVLGAKRVPWYFSYTVRVGVK
jgi:ubiquinone/menaquinone biosynthesis C-methylase UbiE